LISQLNAKLRGAIGIDALNNFDGPAFRADFKNDGGLGHIVSPQVASRVLFNMMHVGIF
jgi:hypothetical protein